jgi:DnaJ-class molecular chaperone
MPDKPCPYCEGQGKYTVYTFGFKEEKRCQFCGGTGKVKTSDERGT